MQRMVDAISLFQRFGLSRRRLQCTQVLQIECAQRGLDRIANAGDSALQVAPKQSNEGASAPAQLRSPDCARAARMIGVITFHPVEDFDEWTGAPGGAHKILVTHRSSNALGGRIGCNNFYNPIGQQKLFTFRIGIFPIQSSLSILIVAFRFLMKHAVRHVERETR